MVYNELIMRLAREGIAAPQGRIRRAVQAGLCPAVPIDAGGRAVYNQRHLDGLRAYHKSVKRGRPPLVAP